MLRFSGCSHNPGSSVLDELQLSNGLRWNRYRYMFFIIICISFIVKQLKGL